MIRGDDFSTEPSFSLLRTGESNLNSIVDSGVKVSVLIIKSAADVELVTARASKPNIKVVFMTDKNNGNFILEAVACLKRYMVDK